MSVCPVRSVSPSSKDRRVVLPPHILPSDLQLEQVGEAAARSPGVNRDRHAAILASRVVRRGQGEMFRQALLRQDAASAAEAALANMTSNGAPNDAATSSQDASRSRGASSARRPSPHVSGTLLPYSPPTTTVSSSRTSRPRHGTDSDRPRPTGAQWRFCTQLATTTTNATRSPPRQQDQSKSPAYLAAKPVVDVVKPLAVLREAQKQASQLPALIPQRPLRAAPETCSSRSKFPAPVNPDTSIDLLFSSRSQTAAPGSAGSAAAASRPGTVEAVPLLPSVLPPGWTSKGLVVETLTLVPPGKATAKTRSKTQPPRLSQRQKTRRDERELDCDLGVGYATLRHNPPLGATETLRPVGGATSSLPPIQGYLRHFRGEDTAATTSTAGARSSQPSLGDGRTQSSAGFVASESLMLTQDTGGPTYNAADILRMPVHRLGSRPAAAHGSSPSDAKRPGSRSTDLTRSHAQQLQAMGDQCLSIFLDMAPLAPDESGYIEEPLDDRVRLRSQYRALHPLEHVRLASNVPTDLLQCVARVGDRLVPVAHDDGPPEEPLPSGGGKAKKANRRKKSALKSGGSATSHAATSTLSPSRSSPAASTGLPSHIRAPSPASTASGGGAATAGAASDHQPLAPSSPPTAASRAAEHRSLMRPRPLDYITVTGGVSQLFDPCLPQDSVERLAALRRKQREAELYFGLATAPHAVVMAAEASVSFLAQHSINENTTSSGARGVRFHPQIAVVAEV